MPYNRLTGNERVLDPACGSGIFLVGAFRRLVNVWWSRNNWQCPDVGTLKRILKESIYGFELEAGAIDLTAFSLNLAICDALQPDVIWSDLKFDRLRESNLFGVDFFSAVIEPETREFNLCKEGFDTIIGNPPFESKLSPAGKQANRIAKRHNPERGGLPDKQVAYLFLGQALNLLRLDGQIFLIQPSGLLYNDKTENFFRNAIARKYRIKAIPNFTSIRNLYEADPKTIAILSRREDS